MAGCQGVELKENRNLRLPRLRRAEAAGDLSELVQAVELKELDEPLRVPDVRE